MRPILITLSGTHGAGKSTTAGKCYYDLANHGLKLSFLRHQDILDPFGFIVRRTARILGLTEHELDGMRPVRALWALYILFIYVPAMVGGIHGRRLFGYSVICDRYIYDLLVGFRDNDRRIPTEALLLRLLPRPDISFVLDAPEERILVSRPEHTREFIRKEKLLYFRIANHFKLNQVSTEASPQSVWERIFKEIESVMAGKTAQN